MQRNKGEDIEEKKEIIFLEVTQKLLLPLLFLLRIKQASQKKQILNIMILAII